MRVVQYRVLTRILNKLEVPDYIFAFEKDKSIPKMAELHVRKEVVMSFDIKDFFPSIKQFLVQEMFIGVGIGAAPARTLSEICTYKSFVPQGALTSPKISNLIAASSFGPIIKQYCDSKGLTLSIYADDITISSMEEVNFEEIKTFVSETLSTFNMKLNKAKSKYMRKCIRQYVCGVVVNQKTNLLRRERYKLRAIVHNIAKNGVDIEAAKNGMEGGEFLSHVRGKLNWFNQLNPAIAGKLTLKIQNVLAQNSFETVITT